MVIHHVLIHFQQTVGSAEIVVQVNSQVDLGLILPLGGQVGVTGHLIDGVLGVDFAVIVLPAHEDLAFTNGSGQGADLDASVDDLGRGSHRAAVGIEAQLVGNGGEVDVDVLALVGGAGSQGVAHPVSEDLVPGVAGVHSQGVLHALGGIRGQVSQQVAVLGGLTLPDIAGHGAAVVAVEHSVDLHMLGLGFPNSGELGAHAGLVSNAGGVVGVELGAVSAQPVQEIVFSPGIGSGDVGDDVAVEGKVGIGLGAVDGAGIGSEGDGGTGLRSAAQLALVAAVILM